jgi:hypothetical protein
MFQLFDRRTIKFQRVPYRLLGDWLRVVWVDQDSSLRVTPLVGLKFFRAWWLSLLLLVARLVVPEVRITTGRLKTSIRKSQPEVMALEAIRARYICRSVTWFSQDCINGWSMTRAVWSIERGKPMGWAGVDQKVSRVRRHHHHPGSEVWLGISMSPKPHVTRESSYIHTYHIHWKEWKLKCLLLTLKK